MEPEVMDETSLSGPQVVEAAPERELSVADDSMEGVAEKAALGVETTMLEGRRARCGSCAGCLATNCGVCVFCKDMPCFGGKGVKRQTCERRACEVLVAQAEERSRTRNERMEEAREVREAERVLKAARREEERQLQLASRAAAKQTRVALRLGDRGREKAPGARRAPRMPTDPAAYGWGASIHPIPVGTAIEVLAVEEGLVGAAFRAVAIAPEPCGTVAQREKQERQAVSKLRVEYTDLLASEASSEHLREWCPKQQIRPKPPPTPRGFHGLVRKGDPLQLLLEDAWWDVIVDAIGDDPPRGAPPGTVHFTVSSVQYDATHAVGAELLRPCWLWQPQSQVWNYHITAGVGTVPHAPLDAPSELPRLPSFSFADGPVRQHNGHFRAMDRTE